MAKVFYIHNLSLMPGATEEEFELCRNRLVAIVDIKSNKLIQHSMQGATKCPQVSTWKRKNS